MLTITTPEYGPHLKDPDTRRKINDLVEKIHADFDALNAALSALGYGDMFGPAGAVDGNLASFNGATGKIIKDSGYKASDFSTLSHGIGTLAARPAFGNAGATYFVSGDGTSDNNGKLWIDTGTEWKVVLAVLG